MRQMSSSCEISLGRRERAQLFKKVPASTTETKPAEEIHFSNPEVLRRIVRAIRGDNPAVHFAASCGDVVEGRERTSAPRAAAQLAARSALRYKKPKCKCAALRPGNRITMCALSTVWF